MSINDITKTIEIFGKNRFETFIKTREGCRGIIACDGKILVSHEVISDYFLIPGGGLMNTRTKLTNR